MYFVWLSNMYDEITVQPGIEEVLYLRQCLGLDHNAHPTQGSRQAPFAPRTVVSLA